MNILDILTEKEKLLLNQKNFKKNEIIYAEGDLCDVLSFVEEGCVEIASYAYNAKEVVFSTIFSNQFFGSNLLFSSSPTYKGNVIALTNCKIQFISKQNLIKILQNNKSFLLEFLRFNSNKSISLTEKTKILSFSNVEDRILYFLYMHNNCYTFHTITLLAKDLAVSREALSRAIKSLLVKKIINIQQKTLMVL